VVHGLDQEEVLGMVVSKVVQLDHTDVETPPGQELQGAVVLVVIHIVVGVVTHIVVGVVIHLVTFP